MEDIQDYEKGWENKSKKFLEYDQQLDHPVRHLILEKAKEIKAESVLDIGCATCTDYPLYRLASIKYIGRDFTEKFIKRARERFSGVNVAYGNVLNLEEFEDGSVDVVYCKDLLEHLPPEKYKTAISEMMRVALKRVMIAFFIAPWEQPTEYRTLKKKHWNNQYSKGDIVSVFRNTWKMGQIRIIPDIGYNKTSLYIVDIQ